MPFSALLGLSFELQYLCRTASSERLERLSENRRLVQPVGL